MANAETQQRCDAKKKTIIIEQQILSYFEKMLITLRHDWTER